MKSKLQTLQAMTSSGKPFNRVVLKPGKEKSLLKRHPWIFSGALVEIPKCAPGEILSVYSFGGEFLAQAYFHPENSLIGRVLTFTQDNISNVILEKLIRAAELRTFFSCEGTYRLVNGEEDGIPGLIIDVYEGVYVLQASTWGIERLKGVIVDLLIRLFHPKMIYEKSSAMARAQEGLPPAQGVLFGDACEELEIEENGIRYLVSLTEGQKTGFFLDQKAMRSRIGGLSKGRRVLNTFSYTGGFSLAALRGGAVSVDSVDSDQDACDLLKRNLALNEMDFQKHRVFCEDVFEFLKKNEMSYDLIILDPPAFAKKRSDVDNACKGYKELHKLLFSKLRSSALVLTSCCSYHIDEPLLQNLVFQAALEVGVEGKIIDRHHLSLDHPISLTHPEGSYMKSLYLYIQPKNLL